MRKSKEVFGEIVAAIKSEGEYEKESIARLVMEALFKVDFSAIMRDAELDISPEVAQHLKDILTRLNNGEPVQYVLGHAWFLGRRFAVDSRVLIPRPETEELVAEALTYLKKLAHPPRILDIGTGSGCIPITLALELPEAKVYATDVSADALAVAAHNASVHKAEVQLLRHNILLSRLPFEKLDLIISNPPYIHPSEAPSMERNVLAFEPHLALFAPEEDPLIFYRRISDEAYQVLNDGGMLIFEINAAFSDEVGQIMTSAELRRVTSLIDMAGKPRIVKGFK